QSSAGVLLLTALVERSRSEGKLSSYLTRRQTTCDYIGARSGCVTHNRKTGTCFQSKGFSKLGCGLVNHAAPSSVTWKWSSRRTPNLSGITIMGSFEKHMPGAR